ncbi:MAG TPA: hypothetical protein VHD90_20540 [Phototrophicaceae bacterium]|nr:hypothetical protein [Phototrophicaceae bacterium]
MPELTDQQFDADAARQLKFNTMVTASQQAKAKERLLRRAAHQIMLEPETPAPVESRAQVIGRRTLHVLNFLIMDSKAFERAHRPWRTYRYENMRRYITIRMST